MDRVAGQSLSCAGRLDDTSILYVYAQTDVAHAAHVCTYRVTVTSGFLSVVVPDDAEVRQLNVVHMQQLCVLLFGTEWNMPP